MGESSGEACCMLLYNIWSQSFPPKYHHGSEFIQYCTPKLCQDLHLEIHYSTHCLQTCTLTLPWPIAWHVLCKLACAVQIGMYCANWYSTCPAYLNQINNVTQLQCTWSLLIWSGHCPLFVVQCLFVLLWSASCRQCNAGTQDVWCDTSSSASCTWRYTSLHHISYLNGMFCSLASVNQTVPSSIIHHRRGFSAETVCMSHVSIMFHHWQCKPITQWLFHLSCKCTLH